jgi:hypothetical protein
MIASSLRFFIAAAMVTALAVAPVAQARDWHDHGRGGYRGDYRHHNNAGAAIIGGLIGLGVGAAIASGGYAAPPPAYYAPAPGYYAPPPPAVYYGY